MKIEDVQVGSTITNGSSVLRIERREERDPHWKCAGWRGLNISLEKFGGNTGQLGFVPDYLLGSWRHVPFEWEPLVGGAMEHRYVWAGDYSHLQHEVRRIEVPA